MSLSTYLYFDGNCAEVFDFYKSVFGGEFESISTFADAPDDMPVDDAEKDRIMHVSLPIDGSVLMGSDTTSMFGGSPTQGSNFALSYMPATREQADQAFPKLSEGGEVTMPLQETFWADRYGMCVDRFGIMWQINCTGSKADAQ